MTSVDGDVPYGNYRRGVFRPGKTMFAGRGISLPGFAVTAGVIVLAFGLGLGAGWLTDSLPGILHADPEATPSPSVSHAIVPTVAPSLPPLAPITRELTQEDRDAGVTTTAYKVRGDGTFRVVPGTGVPSPTGGDVRWVSVSVEDGVTADARAFRAFVLNALNSNRGWGSGGSLQFVGTDGVADYRVVLASPYTTAAVCPDPHEAVAVGPVTEATPSATPSPTPSPTSGSDDGTAAHLCSQDGVIVLSTYDWTAGLPAYGTDYQGSRVYLLMHRLGLLMGRDETTCASGRADVMDAQQENLSADCQVNPWPYPDAPEVLNTPTPAPATPAP